ncbi:1530_t:CDS:1 [Acaulospora morrowiae]|uniref:1530_t:CDS:1 n=1 Tax=Acaulospora morrowiae TaxID=94023 RepID=A0A9N9A7X2_9GLOM|nr:1530_t:CDS:1 [Acaulospora morrowiae]
MSRVIRPVSNLERSKVVLQTASNFSNLGFTVRYKWDELYSLNSNTNSVNTELSKKLVIQVLYPALTNLLQELPNLSVAIRNVKSSRPLFIGLDEVDLSSLVKFVSVSSKDDLEKLFEQEHDLKFNLEDETRPLWRVVVAINKYEISGGSSGNGEDSGVDVSEKARRPDYDFCIFFCWCHAIGDEMSAFAIQGTFLKVLKQALHEYNATPKRTTQSYLPSSKVLTKNMAAKMCDPIEDLHDLQPSLFTIIKEGCSEFLLPSFLQKQLSGQYWAGDKHLNDTPYYQNRVKMFSLPQRSYEKLVAVIDSNNSSFQSVLNTAVLFSGYQHLLTFGEIRSKKFKNRRRAVAATANNTLKIMTPISLRKHVTPEIPWSTMGNFAAESVFNYSFPKPEFPTISFSTSSRNSISTTNSKLSISSRQSNQSIYSFSRRSIISTSSKGSFSRKIRKPKYKKNNTVQNINFWELCHTYKFQLEKSIPDVMGNVGMLSYLPKEHKDLETFFQNKSKSYPNGRGFSIMPSNLGKFPDLEFEPLEEPVVEIASSVTLKNERQSSLLDMIEEDNRTSAFSSLSGSRRHSIMSGKDEYLTHSHYYPLSSVIRDDYYGFGINQNNCNSDSSFSDCSSDGDDFNGTSNWEVVDMIFSQSVWSDGPAICLNSVTYENKFNFTLSYQEGSVEEDKVDRLGEGIVKCLRIVAERGDLDINDIIFM